MTGKRGTFFRASLGRLLCGAVAVVAVPAFGQEKASAEEQAGQVSDEIIVTARYREERLGDVPLSITAISGDRLVNQGIDNIREIVYQTPGVTVRSLGGEYGARPIIRGQGDLSAGVGDPNVSVFLDGVYIFNSAAISLGTVDLERVEVVKGPVSALYGRNAANGAINYVSKRPGDEWTGRALGTVGTDGLYEATGSVMGPLIPGLLGFGITGTYKTSDGNYSDRTTGARAGGYTKKDFRAMLRMTPNEDIEIFASWYHGNDKFDVTPAVSGVPNCGLQPGATVAAPGGLNAGVGARDLFAPRSRYCGALKQTGAVSIPRPASGSSGNDRRFDLVNVNLKFETPIGTFTSITGYSKADALRFNDFSGGVGAGYQQPIIAAGLASAVIGTAVPQTITVNPFFGQDILTSDVSQEVRFQTPQDKWIRAQFGGFIYDGKQRVNTNFALVGTLPTGFTAALVATANANTVVLSRLLGLGAVISPTGAINTANQGVTRSTFQQEAAFGGLEIDPLDGLTISGEVRRTWDRRRTLGVSSFNFFGPTSLPNTLNNQRNFSYDNYRVTTKYTVTPGIMVYGSVGTGTKAGGINGSAAAAGFEDEQGFDPETNTTYELGGKFALFDNKLQLDVAAFRIDAGNLQVFGPSRNPLNPSLIVKNLAKVKTDGFEISATVRPYQGVRLVGGVGYANPKIQAGTFQVYTPRDVLVGNTLTCQAIPSCAARLTRLATPQTGGVTPTNFNAVDLKGLQTPQTSKWTVSIGGDYETQVSDDWGVFFHADYRYESRQFVDVENLAWTPNRQLVNVNLGVTYRDFRLTGFVDNLTNNQTPEGAAYNTRLSDLSSTVLAGVLPTGRQYGLSLAMKF
jgi:outer membrane receptor protein involved in Fe transport